MRDNLIIHINSLAEGPQTQKEIGGRWVAARPEGFGSIWYRLRATWLVFTGRADALIWHKQ
jgi:hypothetical protein